MKAPSTEQNDSIPPSSNEPNNAIDDDNGKNTATPPIPNNHNHKTKLNTSNPTIDQCEQFNFRAFRAKLEQKSGRAPGKVVVNLDDHYKKQRDKKRHDLEKKRETQIFMNLYQTQAQTQVQVFPMQTNPNANANNANSNENANGKLQMQTYAKTKTGRRIRDYVRSVEELNQSFESTGTIDTSTSPSVDDSSSSFSVTTSEKIQKAVSTSENQSNKTETGMILDGRGHEHGPVQSNTAEENDANTHIDRDGKGDQAQNDIVETNKDAMMLVEGTSCNPRNDCDHSKEFFDSKGSNKKEMEERIDCFQNISALPTKTPTACGIISTEKAESVIYMHAPIEEEKKSHDTDAVRADAGAGIVDVDTADVDADTDTAVADDIDVSTIPKWKHLLGPPEERSVRDYINIFTFCGCDQRRWWCDI